MEAGGTAPHGLVHLFEAGDKPWTWGQTISDIGLVIFLKVFKDAFAAERIVLVVIIILGIMEERFEIPNELMTWQNWSPGQSQTNCLPSKWDKYSGKSARRDR